MRVVSQFAGLNVLRAKMFSPTILGATPREPMAEIIEPSGGIIPGTALVPYVHPTLTNKTPVVWPLLVTALSAWAVLMIEWGSLRSMRRIGLGLPRR
jgi:hypothetical protein